MKEFFRKVWHYFLYPTRKYSTIESQPDFSKASPIFMKFLRIAIELTEIDNITCSFQQNSTGDTTYFSNNSGVQLFIWKNEVITGKYYITYKYEINDIKYTKSEEFDQTPNNNLVYDNFAKFINNKLNKTYTSDDDRIPKTEEFFKLIDSLKAEQIIKEPLKLYNKDKYTILNEFNVKITKLEENNPKLVNSKYVLLPLSICEWQEKEWNDHKSSEFCCFCKDAWNAMIAKSLDVYPSNEDIKDEIRKAVNCALKDTLMNAPINPNSEEFRRLINGRLNDTFNRLGI